MAAIPRDDGRGLRSGQAIRAVIKEHLGKKLPSPPPPNPTAAYGTYTVQEAVGLLEALPYLFPGDGIFSQYPDVMENYGQGYDPPAPLLLFCSYTPLPPYPGLCIVRFFFAEETQACFVACTAISETGVVIFCSSPALCNFACLTPSPPVVHVRTDFDRMMWAWGLVSPLLEWTV